MSIFVSQAPGRKTGTITSQSSSGFWTVTDSMGRKVVASSAEQWRRGDSVAIIGNQIVGRAGKTANPKTYEV